MKEKLISTKHKGLKYYNDDLKGKVFVADVTVFGKRYRQILGFTKDEFKTNESTAAIKKEVFVAELKKGMSTSQNESRTKKIYTYNLLFDEYLESCSRAQSKKTIDTKRYYHDKHIKPRFENYLMDNVSTELIQKLINDMLDKGYQPQTAKHIRNIIKSTLQYAIELKHLADNVAIPVKIPKFDNKVEFTLTLEESRRLFDTIINYEEEMYRNIFIFLIHGRRKSEVLKMQWDYIDMQSRSYDVKACINKTRKTLKYPITDILFESLNRIENKKGFVFINPETNQPFHDIRKAWERIKKKAGITKYLRMHDLRHLIGNIVINDLSGTNTMAAAILGHSSTQMVDQRYSSVRVDTIHKGLNSVFDYLQNKV